MPAAWVAARKSREVKRYPREHDAGWLTLENADVVLVVGVDVLGHGAGSDSGQLGDGFTLSCGEWGGVVCFRLVGLLGCYPGLQAVVVAILC